MPPFPDYKSRITPYVFGSWILAAFGGLMFGYDVGISGGVTAMDDFLRHFYPKVHERKLKATENNYCKYDDQTLQLFTSSLYLSALVASFFASKSCSILGRKPTILLASAFFMFGTLLSATANVLGILILGRIFFGVGVGFGNEAVPLFLTEIAPIHLRGGVNILFQLFVTIGIFIANLVNYATASIHPNGWRISLGLAGVPALVLLVGSVIITESPASLVQRNKKAEALAALKKIRGVDDVDLEYEDILLACQISAQVENRFRNLLKKESMPPLIIAILLQIFQQFTGINAIMFYAPILFKTLGYGTSSALLSAVVTGLVNVFSTLGGVFAVDKFGRRKLLLSACVLMFISQMGIFCILAYHLSLNGSLDKMYAKVVVTLVCTFVIPFAWSWGPLGWLIPSETFPMETRASGFAFAVSSNMLFTFIIAQAFLSMMCHMRAGIFFFFSMWIVVMTGFAYFLLPETKGVPIEHMINMVWRCHPVWKRFFDEAAPVRPGKLEMQGILIT